MHLSWPTAIEWICTCCPSWLSCSYQRGPRILSSQTHLWTTSIVTRSDTEPNRFNSNRSSVVYRLRAYFGKLPPMHPREQTIKSSVPKDISSWTHVFLRKEVVKALLTLLYTGTYRVLSHTDKLFILDISGKKETVSIDRVKRAFLNTNTQELHIPPTYTHEHTLTPVEGNTTPKVNYVTTTRSGRRVH